MTSSFRHMETTGLARSVPLLALPLFAGCVAEIPQFDDDPRPEVCGGSVCFAPEHVAVRRWGDGEITLAAWRGTSQCELPLSGKQPIPGQAIVVELKRPRQGARLPVLGRAQVGAQAGAQISGSEEPWAHVRAVRVDPDTGRALADEEGVSGEATILDLDPREGRLRVRIRARWSSGVTSETLLDVQGWKGC